MRQGHSLEIAKQCMPCTSRMHVCLSELETWVPVCHQAWRLFEPSLALLSCAANPCRGISEYHWRVSDCRFGQCKQTAQEILDLVNECNEVEAEAPREVDASRVGSLDLETYAP